MKKLLTIATMIAMVAMLAACDKNQKPKDPNQEVCWKLLINVEVQKGVFITEESYVWSSENDLKEYIAKLKEEAKQQTDMSVEVEYTYCKQAETEETCKDKAEEALLKNSACYLYHIDMPMPMPSLDFYIWTRNSMVNIISTQIEEQAKAQSGIEVHVTTSKVVDAKDTDACTNMNSDDILEILSSLGFELTF